MDTKKKDHIVAIQIRFNDIDIAGHVNNAVYFEYYDVARVAYSNEVFRNTIEWKKEGFVLAHTEIDYMAPVFLDDTIEIQTKVIEIGEKSITMLQHMYRTTDNMLVSSCQSVLVAFDYRQQISMPLPDKWKESMRNYETL